MMEMMAQIIYLRHAVPLQCIVPICVLSEGSQEVSKFAKSVSNGSEQEIACTTGYVISWNQ